MTHRPELPPNWRLIEDRLDGRALEGTGPAGRTLRVDWGDVQADDGHHWRCVVVSIPVRFGRRRELPGWLELDWARTSFIGADVEAYQVHPPGFECPLDALALWACLDAPAGVLPEFTRGTGLL